MGLLPSLSCLAQGQEISSVKIIEPILKKNCFTCHQDTQLKGGIDLKTFFFGVDSHESRMIKGGRVWMKVIEQVKAGHMPPQSRPPLSLADREALVDGINKILAKSLQADNPGRAVIRRLSHEEYHYSILSLVGVDFDAHAKFPSDGSGGAGFDNFSPTLFMTPLRMEQYYQAAEEIMDSAYAKPAVWNRLVSHPYEESFWAMIVHWCERNLLGRDDTGDAMAAAEEDVIPFASQAFRRFLTPDEKSKYLGLFKKVYEGSRDYNRAIKETFKAVLVSPKFLFRYVEEQPIDFPYPLSSFELASRLSYFLWSGPPDKELFDVAYRDNLHDSLVLRNQVIRMLKDPKAKRFSESFATQWFGVTALKDASPIDPVRFPDFTNSIRADMYQEMVEYFHYVLTKSKNFLDLIDSDYDMLNEELAEYYGIPGVKGKEFRLVHLSDNTRGGVITMGSVLVSTSLPLRTSPVKRGQWVLEEILGTPAPPPPPNVPQLPDKAADPNASLHDLLALHRSNPTCMTCHKKMDPIGFGLENFDPSGKWRDSYGTRSIISLDTLPTGEVFHGPSELKKILATKRELFARNLAEKMFTYAIGRSVEFTDEPYMRKLVQNLLDNNFNTESFITALVFSRPFRYAVNNKSAKYKLIAKN